MDTQLTAALHEVIGAIQRRWGSRALRLLGNGAEAAHPAIITTGFAELDAALHIGGLPGGRITEFLGTPTLGMTTIALTVMAEAQARGDLVGHIDLSRTFDAEYAAALGVDLPSLLLVRPSSAADALTIIQALIASGGVGLLVVDSLALLQSVPADAAQLAQALRILPGVLAASPCVLLVVTPLPYSPAMTQAIGFRGSLIARATAIRLHIAREEWQINSHHLGCASRITVLKHRLAPANGSAIIHIQFEPERTVL